MAFSLARAGCIGEAISLLDEEVPLIDTTYPYQVENKARRLLMTDQKAAQAQLAAWEDETVRNLGLEEFREAC